MRIYGSGNGVRGLHERWWMLRRGYGVLEDVPMVIPIALALILFFSALSWATSTVNRTNSRIDTTLALIRVADAFSQWGVLTDSAWDKSCDSLRQREKDVYFFAYLVEPNNLQDSVRSLSAGDPVNLNPSHVFNGKRCISDAFSLPKRGTPLLVRYFPVTYQRDTASGSVENVVRFLVVVVWPKG